MLCYDLSGRPLFRVDPAEAVARDDSGKPVASRVADPGDRGSRRMAALAARSMNGRPALLGELTPSDVATASTRADYGTVVDGCVADRASAVQLVTHDRGYYFLEDVGDATKLVLDPSNSPGAQPTTADPGFAKTPFTTAGYALASKVPRLLSSNADFDLKARVLRRLVDGLRLAREYRVATLLSTSTSFAAGNRVAAAAKWNAGANNNPLVDLYSALAKSALPANLLVLPESVEPYFFTNTVSTQVATFVQGGGRLPEIAFAKARYTLAGATTYLWAPAATVNVPVLRVATEPGTVGTSATFRWLGEDGAGGERVEGLLARDYYDHQTDSDWVVVAHNDVEVVLSNVVGSIITGALA